MSKVISSLLVGIGFDFDKKSAQQIDSGIDSIKSKALQLGSVVAGAFGIKALTVDFANSADMLGKFSQVFGVTANDIQAFGNALATEGGSLESFMSQIENIERARARIKVGDVGFFAPAGKAGIDPNAIANATNATEAYLGLADAFARMTTQERINAAEALGLDESSIRLLSQGRSAVEGLVSKYKNIRPIDSKTTEAAAEFNRQLVEMKANVAGVADVSSNKLLPYFNDGLSAANDWIDANRELLNSSSTTFTGIAAVIAGSGLASTLIAIGKAIPVIGGGIAAAGAGVATVAAGGAGYATGTLISENLSEETNANIGRVVARILSVFGNEEATRALVSEANYGGLTSSYTPDSNPLQRFILPELASAQQSYNASTTQNINVSLELDGAVIDRKVVKVVDGMAQNAIDDISSSNGG